MRQLRAIFALLGALALAAPAWATHVSTALDVPFLRPDLPDDGYLEFINPIEHPGLIGVAVPATPPGVIVTEEFTGFTTAPPGPFDTIELGDSDTTAGDRADFDWVQENRALELGGGGNHPGLVGAMGWCVPGIAPCTPTEASPHVDPGTGLPHGHSVGETIGPPGPLPELINPDWLDLIFAVDVFSVISVGEDSATEIASPGSREAALDYDLAFGNSVTGVSSPGVPVIVWIPGWTGATTTDDFVARWVPAFPSPGGYDLVAIEPASGFGHDEVTEIDAIKAVPEPGTALLVASGLAGLALRRRRRA